MRIFHYESPLRWEVQILPSDIDPHHLLNKDFIRQKLDLINDMHKWLAANNINYKTSSNYWDRFILYKEDDVVLFNLRWDQYAIRDFDRSR